jgi:exportin-1
MNSVFNDWIGIYQQAMNDPTLLLNPQIVKSLDIFLKVNERVAASVKTYYYLFAENILGKILETYVYFSNTINQIYQLNQQNNNHNSIKLMKTIKKSTLKYVTTLISNIDNSEILMTKLLPQLSVLIGQYNQSCTENRDSEVLTVFITMLDKLKNLPYELVESIWNHLCIHTLSMIQNDYSSFPEHRIGFFELLKSLIVNDFKAIFYGHSSTPSIILQR